jgi:chromate transporter
MSPEESLIARTSSPKPPANKHGGPLEVFLAFLKLGLTSFGGPIAHLGYFREAFVVKRGWLDDRSYADLVALCQFLPGPASSQVGIAIGLSRAGYRGALAAWLGFTAPSAIAMVLFAYGTTWLGDAAGSGWLHGLKVAAVAVVAVAVLGMMQTLTPDRERATIAALAAVAMLTAPSAFVQVSVIVLGGVAGALLLPAEAPPGDDALPLTVRRCTGTILLVLSFALLAVFRCLRQWSRLRPSSSSTCSTARALSCSAAGTSFCRCFRPP